MRQTRILRIGRALATVAGVASLAPQVATAQRISSPYEFVERKQDLGPYVAWLMTSRGSADLGPRSGPIYGLQYALRLNDPMQVGAVFGYMDTDRDVIDPRAEGGPRAIGREDITLIMAAARLQLNLTGARTWNNLMPHVIAGLGIVFDASAEPTCGLEATSPQCRLESRERFDFNNSFLAQVGLGAAWLPAERFGFRFSVHDNIWRIESPPGFREEDIPAGAVPPENEWLNNFQFTAALTYWF